MMNVCLPGHIDFEARCGRIIRCGQSVTITEGGITRRIQQREALFKSLVAKAVKGDARSAALVVKLMEQRHGAPRWALLPEATFICNWLDQTQQPDKPPAHSPVMPTDDTLEQERNGGHPGCRFGDRWQCAML